MPTLTNLEEEWGGMRAEKFGKVIFSQKGEGATTEDPVELLQFSNLDGKWYSGGGKKEACDDAFATNMGKAVSLRCSVSVEDQFGKVVSREMTFLLPDKLGSLPEPNMELLVNGNARMVEQTLRAGYSTEDINRSIKMLEGGAMPAFIGVGKGADPDIMLHLLWEITFVWDDVVDTGKSEEFKRYDRLEKIINYFIDLFRGGHEHGDGNSSGSGPPSASVEGMMNDDKLVSTMVKEHQLVYRLLREDIIHAARKFGIDPGPALEDMAQCFASLLVEQSVEWNAHQRSSSQMFRRVQRVNREVTSAVGPTLEFYALVEGISVKEEIRRSMLFQQFKSLVVTQVTLVNDIFSYARETVKGQVNNILYLYHVEDGLSMEEALERIEVETNQVCEALVELGELLVRLYEKDEGLARFVKLGKDLAYGHLLWYSYSQRYYPDLVFDMIVHN